MAQGSLREQQQQQQQQQRLARQQQQLARHARGRRGRGLSALFAAALGALLVVRLGALGLLESPRAAAAWKRFEASSPPALKSLKLPPQERRREAVDNLRGNVLDDAEAETKGDDVEADADADGHEPEGPEPDGHEPEGPEPDAHEPDNEPGSLSGQLLKTAVAANAGPAQEGHGAGDFLDFLGSFEPVAVAHPHPLLKAEPFRSNAFTKRRAEAFSNILEEAMQLVSGYYESTKNIKAWEAPFGFASMSRPPRVLFFEGYWWLAGNDGRAGQTLGDITIWVDYYLAMEKLGAEIEGFPKRASEYPKSRAERKAYYESFDMILCDYDAVDHLKRRVFKNGRKDYEDFVLPRLYIQDTFGTEAFYDDPNCPERGPLWYWGANLKAMDRYLVMIRHFDESNTFIGNAAVVTGQRHLDLLLQDHLPPRLELVDRLSKDPTGHALLSKRVVGAPRLGAESGVLQDFKRPQPSPPARRPRRWKALLWGKAWKKEPHQIGRFVKQAKILADHIPVIATVSDFPVGPMRTIHPNIENLGPQPFKDLQDLLDEVAIVVNFGRYSSIGHLATEALSHGAMLWLGDAPMDYHGSKPNRKVYSSTHPHFEEDPGGPMVQKVKLEDRAAVSSLLAHFKALHEAETCDEISDPAECRLFKFYQEHGTPVPDFTVPSLLVRLNNLLHKAVRENRQEG